MTVSVAFIELYREQLYDLLSSAGARKEDCVLDLREDPVKGVVAPGLTENLVASVQETMRQLETGSAKRVTAATAMNNTSSRSHAIFTVQLNIVSKREEDAGACTVSKFHLVDLAGSERAKKTMATGDRFKEGAAINQGLLALGNVIAALGEDNPSAGKSVHIPYRNSKLTRLLQDSLGGNSFTLMVACVSPADANADETLSTLRYADRARKIKNKPVINVNGSDAEVNRLRAENQELRLKLIEATAASVGGGCAKEDAAAKEAMAELKEENKRLSHALLAAQEELTHMNEKVIMHESGNEKLRTKFKELVATLDVMVEEGGGEDKLLEFRGKVKDVVQMHEEAEKTIMDYDVSHAELTVGGGAGDEGEGDDDHDEYLAEHVERRNAITVELQNLNRALAQKEKLASAMEHNEQKLQEMRKTYETSLKSLESELETLQKEKDELMQRQRNASAAEATSKVSEQRRKRIQDLEGKLGELRKKVLEQQRAIKLNEKSEAQVKKLGEEIRTLKQAKVRLIRQFKEDAEKLRQYKQQKEKEVQKLKQNERKQQAKMAKMENLHMKKENVLRRKVEEAINANKRLKDVLDRQKAARHQNNKGVGGGLVGAGDRVRSWLNDEVNVVIGVKEATQSREVLLNDRKALTRELNKLKADMRGTMTGEEMNEHQKKVEKLKADLETRNLQISQLQKQIADQEQQEHSNTGSSISKQGRFDALKSLTEARIALDHLFDKYVDHSMFNTHLKSELEELTLLYNEAVKNTNVLESEIAQNKHDHETHLTQVKQEYEERVLSLLNSAESAPEVIVPKVPKEEITKYSRLNEELLKMNDENERLRNQMMNEEAAAREKEAKMKINKMKRRSDRYTVDEFFRENMDEFVDEEDERSFVDDVDNDPDWERTPLCKRIRKLRETASNATLMQSFGGGVKRKTDSSDTDDDDDITPKPKRFSNPTTSGCNCKANLCRNRQCRCRKQGPVCTDACGCDPATCRNRDVGERSALSDLSNNDTNSLLNDTYTAAPADKSGNSNKVEVEETPRKPSLSAMERTYFKSPLAPEDGQENSWGAIKKKPATAASKGHFPYPSLA